MMNRIKKSEGKRKINVVEIGSGTGAGANELSWLHTNLNYTAVEMQAQGAASCRRYHQNDRFVARINMTAGQDLGSILPDGFADVVLIPETHIADVVPLDKETKNILDQVKRLLRPGGMFVWGNAIPTSNWAAAFAYLQEIGLKKREVYDVTEQAIAARDEDTSRVEHYWYTWTRTYYGLQMFPSCRLALNRLFLNFCRHPGTSLYKRMLRNSNVTATKSGLVSDWCSDYDVPSSLCTDGRIDSYVQLAYEKPVDR